MKQCELGSRVGKPTPVELTARDAGEDHCQSKQCAQYPHAAFEDGDAIGNIVDRDPIGLAVSAGRSNSAGPHAVRPMSATMSRAGIVACQRSFVLMTGTYGIGGADGLSADIAIAVVGAG